MGAVKFEPFPELPFKSGRKKLGRMAMAILMIEALYKNLPPRKDKLWQDSWDTLRGWLMGIEFFIDGCGADIKKKYHTLQDAILREGSEDAPALALELAQEKEIEAVFEKPQAAKKAMLLALKTFRPKEKKMEWVGFIDSLRVSLALGSPIDGLWALLDTAYRSYFFDDAGAEPVEKALSAALAALQ